MVGGEMEFTEEHQGEVIVFHLSGKFMGGPETQHLCARLKELVAADRRMLVMDFQDVRWINSLGVGTIIACLTTLRNRGGDIHFANLHHASAEYFHITKIESVVQIYQGVDAAVESFVKSPA